MIFVQGRIKSPNVSPIPVRTHEPWDLISTVVHDAYIHSIVVDPPVAVAAADNDAATAIGLVETVPTDDLMTCE